MGWDCNGPYCDGTAVAVYVSGTWHTYAVGWGIDAGTGQSEYAPPGPSLKRSPACPVL